MNTPRPSRPGPRAARRGFTLLETMLAALVGGLILMSVMGILTSIEGIDRRLQARFASSSDLARTRTVVGRAMDALLMSAEPPRAAAGAEQERPPARFLLEGAPARRRGGTDTVQRLEVVVSRWPVGREVVEEQRAANERLAEVVPAPGPGGNLRCAFELAPDGEGTWTLWWRPLPLPEDGGEEARARSATEDPNAVPLVGGLVRCNWTAFDDRERKTRIASAWATELPAYVELELETESGATANWMFEVAWSNGPETARDDAGEEAEGQSEAGDGGTTTGPGSGTRRAPARGGRRGGRE